MARREQLREEDGVAHPTVALAEAGVAGIVGGELRGGGRNRASVVSVIRGTGGATGGVFGPLVLR